MEKIISERNKDVNYLYGRLIALFDGLEKASRTDKSYERPTVAYSSIPSFTSNAYATLGIVKSRINPYERKLLRDNVGLYKSYDAEIKEVIQAIGNCETNRKTINLSASWINGFYDQRDAIYKKSSTNTSENNS